MAQITVDTNESLDSVLRLIGAAYGVSVGVVDSDGAPTPARPASNRRPRRSGRTGRTATAGRPRGRRSSGSATSSADVRAWAREHGHTVSDRGRLPAPILEAYRAARS